MNAMTPVAADRPTVDPRVTRAIERWDQLKADRIHDEYDWTDIDRLIRGTGIGGFQAPPTGDRQKALSSSPIMAHNNLAAELHGAMVNPANRWMEMKSPDPDLARWKPMALWSEAVSTIILQSFRPNVSNFYTSALELFGDISSLAQGAQYDEMVQHKGRILDVTLHLGEIVVDIDAWGEVTEFVRLFRLTPHQAARRYGVEALPERVRTALDRGNTDRFNFYQHVYPNESWQKGRMGWIGKAISSVHVCEEGKAVVRHAGFDSMPIYFPRYRTISGRTYAIGPGHYALPASRVLQLMTEANLRAGQYASDNVLLAPDRAVWPTTGRIKPGDTIYNGVNMRGEALIQPLNNFSGTGLTMEMAAQKVEEIQNAFNWSLLNLANRTGLTPIEAMERQQEKYRVMAPNMGRIQEEYLAPKIRRRFRMLWEARQLPAPPDGLPQGASLDVVYTSAAAMAQRSGEGAATSRAIMECGALAQLDPQAAARLGKRFSADDVAEVMLEAFGAPARVLRSREEADEMQAAEEEAQQAAAMLQAGQGAAAMLKDLSAAGQQGVAA